MWRRRSRWACIAPRGGLRSLGRDLWRREDGAEFVELVLVLPVLLVVAFGVIELGNVFEKAHAMTALSREGANIAARGTALDTVAAVTMANGASIGLDARGGTIVSRIVVEGGTAFVRNQVASSGLVGKSRIGDLNDPASGFGGVGLQDGQELFAVEILYDHREATPLSRFIGAVVPDTMYTKAVF